MFSASDVYKRHRFFLAAATQYCSMAGRGFCAYIGKKILVTADDGKYSGIVYAADPNNGRISINKGLNNLYKLYEKAMLCDNRVMWVMLS